MRSRNGNLELKRLCELFGVSRFAYYRRESRQVEKEDHGPAVLDMVRLIRRELPGIGTPKLYYLLKPNLKDMGIKMGRNKLNELIQNNGLGVKSRRRRFVRTTDSRHDLRKYPNLVKDFEPQMANELWVTDITYLPFVRKGFCFLTLITDAYSHKIVGYHLSRTMKALDCAVALHMALEDLPLPTLLIHHSDRGKQFGSELYTEMLLGRSVRISMTENSDPKENAIAERINGILKNEMKLGCEHKNMRAASKAVKRTVGSYNNLRPHASVNFLTPAQAHGKTGPIPKRWKNYRKEHAIKMKERKSAEHGNGKSGESISSEKEFKGNGGSETHGPE